MLDLISLTKTVGYTGLFLITFAESGLLIGFFLPGDSLLFTAGFVASQGILDIMILIPLLFLAAVAGDTVGYTFGYRIGPKLFKKKDSIMFSKENLARAQVFFDKYGPKTIVLARFFPVIRTFAPILAGVAKMRYPVFFFYNVLGGIIWSAGLLILGYVLGRVVPDAHLYILPIILIVILFTSLPQIIHVIKNKKIRIEIINQIKKIFFRKL
jgi:membrane-associated protein